MTYFINVLRVENENFEGVGGLNGWRIDEICELDVEVIDFRHAVGKCVPDVNNPIESNFDV